MDKWLERISVLVSLGITAAIAYVLLKPQLSHAGHNVTDGYCFTCERAR